MTGTDPLTQGRRAYERRRWSDAVDALSAADMDGQLDPDDLERLATATYLIGRDEDSDRVLERAHRGYLDRDRPERAARAAFWLGMKALGRGNTAQGSGWLARAGRLVDGIADCVEQGYLLIPQALVALEGGDPQAAAARFEEAGGFAERFDDPDLRALARLGEGQSAVRLGEPDRGLAQLDEVMVSVVAGEVSPIPSGIIYCATIEACRAAFDLQRAHEWTSALRDWCDAQPDLVPYRGQCLVHRSEILQLHGEWHDAMDEARRARERLSEPAGQPAVGAAHYQVAEMHRLRGDFGDAEEAYRLAGRSGRSPQPGLARLRLAQGRVGDAQAALRRALDESRDVVERAHLLSAYAEAALAADDAGAAGDAAAELADIADDLDAPALTAVSAHVTGAVQLVEGDARGALQSLGRARAVWHELDVPYEAARVQVLRGLACRELGDDDGADLELAAARDVFTELGAEPELSRLEELDTTSRPERPGGLTERELEVLRLVATGKRNRAIAEELVISEHTVARHVQNIFAKLGVTSRTAAAAFAFERELL